jgi:hypothetical protein
MTHHAMSCAVLPPTPIVIARIVAIVAGLGVWYLTQALLAKRSACAGAGAGAGAEIEQGAIFDGIHHLTRRTNQYLLDHSHAANALLVASSLVIDLLGGYLLISAVIGRTFGPFVGLLMLFALRQICQAFCPLPPPKGMIWRSPGFPTVLVTYGTSNDLFFSGHTALAVYGALTLAAAFGPIGIASGVAIMLFEIIVVLLLRAHYTMDVFTGAVTAVLVFDLTLRTAPAVDRWIGVLVARI